MSTAELKRVRPASIDTPAQSALGIARKAKKRVARVLKDLRQQLRDEPLGGNRAGLMLAIDNAKIAQMNAKQAEKNALRVIERRARELGQTIGVDLPEIAD